MEVVIEEVSTPFFREDPATPGDYFKLQTLTVFSSIWTVMTVEVCDEGFSGTPPGGTAPCSSWTGGQTTSNWRVGWQASGSPTGTLITPITRVVIGTLDASLKTATLFSSRIQAVAPACGGQVGSGPAYEPDWLLDNIGVGLVTADISLEDEFPKYTWTGQSERLKRKFTARWNGTNTSWQSDTPGTTLPLDGLVSTILEGDFLAEVGPAVPARTAYGRIQWDFLWHGTCTVDGQARWCLPDEHPRLAYDPSITNPSAYPTTTHLVAASDCASGCSMACPDPTEANDPLSDQVRYDFRMLSAWLEEIYDGETLPVGSGSSTYLEPLSQRAALRVTPYSEYKWATDNTIGGIDVDWVGSLSLPSFLAASGGCDITADNTGTIYAGGDDTSPTDPHDWSWIEPSASAYQAQTALLVDALTNPANLLLDGVDATVGSSSFEGFDADPRVFSVDIGSVGSFGEWNIAGANDTATAASTSFRIEAGLSFASTWSPGCRTTGTPDTYDIQTTAWWAMLMLQYEDGFPTEASSDQAYPHLVGKHTYPDDGAILPVDSDPTYPDNRFCYRPQEYIVGRRGTFDEDDDGSAGPFTGRRSGQRFDAWGRSDIRNGYADSRETAVAQASRSWEVGSYQAEMVDDWPKLASSQNAQVEYGIWDLEETIRYSIASHYSLFNFKGSHLPFAEPALTPSGTDAQQEVTDEFCDCYPSSSACVAHAVNRLLTNVGPRIHLFARSYRRTITTAEDLRLRARFANLGNAPTYLPTQLEFGFVDRDDFDYLSDYSTAQTYPRPSRAPTSSDVATVITDRQDVPLATLDPRELLPADTPNITPLASRSTAGTYTGDDADEPDSDYLFDTADPASEPYPFPFDLDPAEAPYESCARGNAVDSLAGYYSVDQTGTQREVVGAHSYGSVDAPLHLLDIWLDPPSTAGDYMVVYRFRDISVDGLTGSDHRPVHLDLPMDSAIGDDTDQRWHFFGYLDLETP